MMRYLGAYPSEKDMVEKVLPDVGRFNLCRRVLHDDLVPWGAISRDRILACISTLASVFVHAMTSTYIRARCCTYFSRLSSLIRLFARPDRFRSYLDNPLFLRSKRMNRSTL